MKSGILCCSVSKSKCTKLHPLHTNSLTMDAQSSGNYQIGRVLQTTHSSNSLLHTLTSSTSVSPTSWGKLQQLTEIHSLVVGIGQGNSTNNQPKIILKTFSHIQHQVILCTSHLHFRTVQQKLLTLVIMSMNRTTIGRY